MLWLPFSYQYAGQTGGVCHESAAVLPVYLWHGLESLRVHRNDAHALMALAAATQHAAGQEVLLQPAEHHLEPVRDFPPASLHVLHGKLSVVFALLDCE